MELESQTGHEMARKIHNLLRTGLTSELFLLAYIKPDKPRRLAKRLYDSEDPDTSKIYPAIHSLTLANHVKMNDDNLVCANIKSLVNGFEQMLQAKKLSLEDNEKAILLNLLQAKMFISAMAPHALEKIRKNSKSQKHDTDALSIVADTLGAVTSTYHLGEAFRSNDNEVLSRSDQDAYKEMAELFDDEGVLNSMNQQMRQMKKENPELQIANVDSMLKQLLYGIQLNIYLKSMDVPDNLYDKLSALTESSNIFLMSKMISGFAKMQYKNPSE